MKSKLNHSDQSNTLPKWMFYLIGCFAFIIYLTTLKHGFVLDDMAVIEQNRFVQKGFSGIPEILTTFYQNGYWDVNSGLYRPFSLVMFAIEYSIFPDSPFFHHFINIFFYAISCSLLMLVLSKIFKTIHVWFIFFTVLLFVSHPIHTEVVANIKSRDEIMALFFFLLSAYFLYRHDTRKTSDYIFSTISFVFALLSKEGVVALIPLFFIIDYHRSGALKKCLSSISPIIVVTIVWSLYHQYVVGKLVIHDFSYQDNSLVAINSMLQQKATAFGMLFDYEIKSFFPYLMSYDYSFPQVKPITFLNPAALLGLISFVLAIGFFFYFFKRKFILSFAIATIFLPLLLTGNIFIIIGSTMADRFLYVPSLGAAILLVYITSRVLKNNIGNTFNKNKVVIPIGVILLIYTYKTYARNKDWASNETLFTSDVVKSPNSARTHYNYAKIMEGKADENTTGQFFTEAIEGYNKAILLDKGYRDAYINLGVLYKKQNRHQDALTTFQKGFNVFSNDKDVLGGLGEAYFHLGQKDSAYYYVSTSLQHGNNLVGIYLIKGTLEFEMQNYKAARTTFEEALVQYPENINLLNNYGNVLGADNNMALAAEQFRKVLSIDPNNPSALHGLAMTSNHSGE
ncbi:MAG: tetratricopeptide repeat protein [Flavobacteriales bacterium]